MPNQTQSSKIFDLEKRTFLFARKVRDFLKTIPPNQSNPEDKKQLLRSSGSVAANYVEANEAISTKDFALRVKIAKKEAKESLLWLELIGGDLTEDLETQKALLQECIELGRIFGAILKKIKV